METQNSSEIKSKDDMLFDAEMTIIKIEGFIDRKSYLNAIEMLFEFENQGIFKDKVEELINSIKNQGAFIENGLKGQAYYKNRNYEKALEYLKIYLKENSKDIKGWEIMANLYEKNNDYESAIECYDSLEDLTNDLSIFRKKAYCFYKLGDIKETLACLDYIIKKDPGNKDASEFKKKCLRDYRSSGLRDQIKNRPSRKLDKDPDKERIKIIAEIILLIVIVACFSGVAIYFLTRTERALKGLNSEDNRVKLQSIGVLSGQNDKEIVDSLKEKLNDPSPSIRATTVYVLSETENPEIVEAILPLVKDPDWSVRKTVLEAIGKLGDEKVAGSLLYVIKNRDEVPFIRILALESLEKTAPEVLSKKVPELINEKEKKVQIYVLDYVKRKNLKNHLSSIEKMLADELDPELSQEIAKTISKLKNSGGK